MPGPTPPVSHALRRSGGRDRVEGVLIVALTTLLLGQAALVGVAIWHVREAEAPKARTERGGRG